MKNIPLYLPGFNWPKLRRKPRTAQQIMAEKIRQLKQKSFSQLGECLGKFIPAQFLCPASSGALSRRGIYSKENIFWAFLSQALDADGGCKEVIRKLQAFAAILMSQALKIGVSTQSSRLPGAHLSARPKRSRFWIKTIC